MPSPLLPEVPGPASVTFKKKNRTKTSQTESGRIYSRSTGGSYYEATLTYPVMRLGDFAALNAFLESQEGKNGIFYVKMPNNYSGASGAVIGNFANYNNDTKLHLITGTSPIVTNPAGRVPGGSLVTSNVYMRCSLARDVQQVKIDKRNLISRFEIDLIERV